MPTRSCVVCRGKENQSSLIRIGLNLCDRESELVFDLTRRISGRGFYCHATVRCLFSKKFRACCIAAIERGWKARGEKAKLGTESVRSFDGLALRSERSAEVEMNCVEQGLRAAVNAVKASPTKTPSKRELAAVEWGEKILSELLESRRQDLRSPASSKQRIRL